MHQEHYKTLSIDGFQVAGYTIRTTPTEGKDMQDIGALWQRFEQEQLFKQIPHKLNHDILAIYYDYVSDHRSPYSYMIGVKVTHAEELPTGITSLTIPASQYALFTAKGHFPQCLVETWG